MAKRSQVTSSNRMHLLAFVVFLVVSVLSLRVFFASGDPVAFHDFSPMYKLSQLFRPYDFPWDPNTNLGTPVLLLGNAVYNLPLITLSLTFGSVVFANKVLLVLCMALSGFGFYLAFAYLFKSKTAGFVAGLCMMFNPFTLTRWQFGQNTILLAYAVLPFAVLAFFRVMKEGGRIILFACGLLTGFLIYINPQVAYLFVLFALLYAVFDVVYSGRVSIPKRLRTRAVQMSLTLSVALAVAFPFFYQLANVNLHVYATRAEEAVMALSPTDFAGTLIPQLLLIAFTIITFFILWWKSGFTKMYQWWKNNSVGDSSSFLIRMDRQQIHFFAVLALFSAISIVLIAPPLTPAYSWLFNHVPGFGMFREVQKLFMLSAFSMAFFIGLAAEGIKLHLTKAKNHRVVRRVLPLLLISLIVTAFSWQFATGDIGGSVGTVQIPEAYKELDSWLSSQSGNFRVAFFPPATWASTYTWASARWFMDPLVALQAKPTVALQSDQDLTQAASFTRWVYAALYSNRTSDWGKLLSLLGVKYVVVRLDADMPSDHSDLSAFSLANTLAAWSTQSSLKLVKNFTSVLVYENPSPLPFIYQADGLSLVVGDRSALISIANIGFNFSQYPAAFLDDNTGLVGSLVNDSECVFFQGDPYWSMLTSTLGEDCVVKPWNYAEVSVNATDKWVNGALMWYLYNGDLNTAPDGYIYTEGSNTINIPLNVKYTGDYCILAQVYDGLPDSKGIQFAVDGVANHIFTPTCSTDGAYKWVEIGNASLNQQSQIQISGLGGPTAVSKIAVVPQNAIVDAEQNVSRLLHASGSQVVYLLNDHTWNCNSSALIVNPQANDGRLIDLSKSSAETQFYVFNEDAYTLNLTFQNPQENTAVTVHVDNLAENLTLKPTADKFATEVTVGPVSLQQGYHVITLEDESGNARLSTATLSSCTSKDGAPFGNSAPPEVPSYSTQSGSQYTINATAGYLAFLEAGNSYWNLQGPNGSTAPITIFNYGALFPIPKRNSEYTLRYLGLEYAQQSSLITVAAITFISVALCVPRVKRFLKEAEKNEA